jgi:hypothetical protein
VTEVQAVSILIRTARRELKRRAFNANLYDRLGFDEPAFRRASRERRRIRRAIEILMPGKPGRA